MQEPSVKTNNGSKKKPLSPQAAVIVAAMLVMGQNCVCGLGNPISKVAIEALGVYPFLAVRYSIALLVLLVFFGKRIITQLRAVPVRTWLASSVCIAFCYIFINVALGSTAATSVGFLSGLSVIMTPLIMLVLYRTPYPLRNIPILALLVVGLYLLCAMGGIASFGLGEICALLASLTLAFSMVLGGKAMEDIDPLTLTAAQTAVTLVFVIGCCFFLQESVNLSALTPNIWAILVYLAVVCSIGGFVLQNTAIRLTSASNVALVQTLGPALTAGFSYLILKETLSPAGLVGAVIILACVVAATLLDARDKNKQQ